MTAALTQRDRVRPCLGAASPSRLLELRTPSTPATQARSQRARRDAGPLGRPVAGSVLLVDDLAGPSFW